jgi:GT2 family glycosyltransferase
MALISVVMPVLDTRPAFLLEAIESILTQTHINLELIVVDDGSRDQRTLDVLSRCSQQDARVRVVRHDQQQGVARALNTGLGVARGDFIARMDSDDVSMSTRLEEQLAYLNKHPYVAVVGTAVEIFYSRDEDSGTTTTTITTATTTTTTTSTSITATPTGTTTVSSIPTETNIATTVAAADETRREFKETPTSARVIVHPCTPGLVRWSMAFYCSVAHPTVLVRADAMRALGGYSDKYAHCEDYHLWLRFLALRPSTAAAATETIPKNDGSITAVPTAVEIANLPGVLLRLRKHGGGVSARRALEQSTSADIAAEDFLARQLPGTDRAPSQYLRDPSLLTELTDIRRTFDLLLAWETHCCTLCPMAAKDIRADCAKRMGELVTLAMQLDGSSSITTGMWRVWMGRDPRAMLASLLGS